MQEYDEVLSHFKSSLDYGLEQLDRYTVLLRDGETTATIYPINSVEELPEGLLAFLCDEFNMEIEKGDQCPFLEPMDLHTFQSLWFSHFAGVMILGDAPTLEGPKQWEKECLGSFLIKPNYPGRSGHICTASFLVNAGIRGQGIGRTMAECFLQWAPRLGYTYALFSLVFETGVAIRKIFELTNFKRVGRIKLAAILKGHDSPVDSIIYGKELVSNSDPTIGAYRFDKIRYYLETGKYPAMADRAEKSRLRSASSHYRLEDGKLMLRDKEVVSDPVRQIQICSEMHLVSHAGINRTTGMVSEKYHWARIKDTVAAAIKGCRECRNLSRSLGLSVPVDETAKRNGKRLNPSNVSNRRKMIHTLPNNPNARNIVKSRIPEEIVSSQLRNGDDNILSTHDLLTLDDNIMAAVEAAQRSQMRGHASYAEAAAGGASQDYQQYHSDYDNYDERKHEHESETASLSNVHEYDEDNRDEIEIARALIQANEDVNHDNGNTNDNEVN